MTIGIIVIAGAAFILMWALSGSREVAAVGGPESVNVHEQELALSGFDRLILPSLMGLGRRIGRVTPNSRVKAMRTRIILAGKQQTWNVEKAMALKAFGLLAGLAGAIALLTLQQSLMTFIGAGLLVFAGFISVDYFLDKAAARRQAEITRALPDMLDQVTVCVEAGLGFDASLMRVATTNHNVLAEELGRTLQDIRLGVPRTQALHTLLDRTDVQDLRLFVRALIQAERSGIPIARVLQVQSDEVREKRRQAAEERAMKLPVMLVMPLVLCILPSLFTVIMGPAVLRLVRNGAV